MSLSPEKRALKNSIHPGSQNLSRRKPQESMIKIVDLDLPGNKKQGAQAIILDNTELNSFHLTDRSKYGNKIESVELLLLDQFTSTKHNLNVQDAIIGQKKHIFKRQSGMSNKRSKSPSN